MIKHLAIACVGLLWAAGPSSAELWDDFAAYQYNGDYGRDDHVAKKVERLIIETSPDQYAGIEDRLIAVVSSEQAPQDAKALSCRFLQQVGSAKCIPAVAPLLMDEVLSDYARLVLELLPGDAASKALRDALKAAPDVAKPGILGSLAARKDTRAVSVIAPLAKSDVPAVAEAAIRALGAIGGRPAARALTALKPTEAQVPFVQLALADCARNTGGKTAIELCKKVLSGPFWPARLAALKVLAENQPSGAAPIVALFIKGEDARLRDGAISLVASGEVKGLTQPMLALLGELPAEQKVLLIGALASRGDRTAVAPLADYLTSEEAAVRAEATSAVAALGDASAVKMLIKRSTTPETRATVKTAIAGMADEGVNAALVEALSEKASVLTVLDILAARAYAAATPAVIPLTKDADEAVRKAAWNALGQIASEVHMDAVLQALLDDKDPQARRLAGGAVQKIVARSDEKALCMEAVANRYDAADAETKSVLVAAAALSGDPASLAMVRKALASDVPELSMNALRALAAWPNASAADDLLQIVQKTTEDRLRILALRGYIRLAGLTGPDLTSEQSVQMFKTALGLATRLEEKQQIAGGLRTSESGEALDLLLAFMDDPQLLNEAQSAALQVAETVRHTDATGAVNALERLKDSSNEQVATQAKKLLSEITVSKKFVMGWLVSEAYDGNIEELFAKKLPPETNDADVKWTVLKNGIGTDRINLHAAVGGRNHCVVFMKTTLVLPKAQAVRFGMGSDDAIKLWVNGALVHENLTYRGVNPGQDQKTVELKEGETRVMMAIYQGTADWGASLMVTTPEGEDVEGLRVIGK